MCVCVCVQGYEKANATQDTMYQVRWGADYLMKMVGHGSDSNLEIIYQVRAMSYRSQRPLSLLACWSTDLHRLGHSHHDALPHRCPQ